MARGPITWQNVAINSGADSASLGNAASSFGRTAQQGFDSLFNQTQERIAREDALRTNEAITAALKGGPTTSDDRRVDATMLQSAVETQLLSNRQGRQLEDDLLSSAVNRRLNDATATVRELDAINYERKLSLDERIAAAEAEYKENQSAIALANFEELQRQRAKEEKIDTAIMNINRDLFSPEFEQNARAKFEEFYANEAPEGATEIDKQRSWERWLESSRDEVFNNPNMLFELSVKYDVMPIDIFERSEIGQRARRAQSVAEEALAERLGRTQAAQQEALDSAKLFEAGNSLHVSFDEGLQDYVWRKDVAATEATFTAVWDELGVDLTNKKTKALADKVQAAVKDNFSGASAARQVLREIVRNGEIPNDYQQIISGRREGLRQRSRDDRSFKEVVGGSKEENARNYFRAIESRNAPAPSAEEAQAALEESPAVFAATALSIPVRPLTVDARDKARKDMQAVADGLAKSASELQVPADSSPQVKQLAEVFKYHASVANGGLFLPNQPGAVAVAAGPSNRVAKPGFKDKRQHAIEAANALQQLQRLIEQEQKQKELDNLALSLEE